MTTGVTRDVGGADEAPSITVVRTIAAPVARVFAAWTDPALLQQWLAPGFMRVVEARVDARPGGRYRVVVADPAGNRHVTTGEYREVVRDRRLVQTWIYEGDDPPVTRIPTLLTVDFRDTGAGATELAIRQDQLPTPEYREGNRAGWASCLDKLARLVADGG